MKHNDSVVRVVMQSCDRLYNFFSPSKGYPAIMRSCEIEGRSYTPDEFYELMSPYYAHPCLWYKILVNPKDLEFILRPDLTTEAWLRKKIKGDSLSVHTLSFSSAYKDFDANATVSCIYIKNEEYEDSPCVVVVGGWGRKTLRTEMKLYGQLAKIAGIECLLIHLPYHGPREPPNSEWSGQFLVSPDLYWTVKNFQNVVSEVRTAVYWFKKKLNKKRVGIMGYSLGSVFSTITLSVEQLLDFGILCIGACNLSDLIWDNIITTRLKQHLIGLGISCQDLQKAWSISDPDVLHLCIDPDKILMFSTSYDEVLKPSYQNRLWEILKRPTRIWLPTAHYSSFFYFNRIVSESVKFIQQC